MKTGGLYRRETPDAPAELVERTMSVDEANTQGGRSGAADSTVTGSEGLVQASGGSQATAPTAAAATDEGSGNPQAPAADAGRTGPSAPAPSTRTRKGG
jgi:hypothetical protein